MAFACGLMMCCAYAGRGVCVGCFYTRAGSGRVAWRELTHKILLVLLYYCRCDELKDVDMSRSGTLYARIWDCECESVGHWPQRQGSSFPPRDASDPRICSSALARCAPLQVLARSDMMDMVVGIRDTTVTAQLPS